jgi:hypothetical protein
MSKITYFSPTAANAISKANVPVTAKNRGKNSGVRGEQVTPNLRNRTNNS